MLTITDTAADKAKEILTAEGKANWGIRLYVEGGGCCSSYGLDLAETATDNDEVVEKNGLKVFIDKGTMQSVEGLVMDFIDDGERQGFVLTGGPSSCGTGNDSSCGCGCSSC
jgi:iron-sulfur cluster assembly accessory protein